MQLFTLDRNTNFSWVLMVLSNDHSRCSLYNRLFSTDLLELFPLEFLVISCNLSQFSLNFDINVQESFIMAGKMIKVCRLSALKQPSLFVGKYSIWLGYFPKKVFGLSWSFLSWVFNEYRKNDAFFAWFHYFRIGWENRSRST